MSSSDRITQSTFDGLAFPVAKVSYNGDSGNYSATITWDRDHTFRARVGYDHAIGSGARNAIRAALKAHAKLVAEFPALASEEHVAIPGDLDEKYYVFTFVPARFFEVQS